MWWPEGTEHNHIIYVHSDPKGNDAIRLLLLKGIPKRYTQKVYFLETAEGTDQSKHHLGVVTYVTNPSKVKCHWKCNLIKTVSKTYPTNIDNVYLKKPTIWKVLWER